MPILQAPLMYEKFPVYFSYWRAYSSAAVISTYAPGNLEASSLLKMIFVLQIML